MFKRLVAAKKIDDCADYWKTHYVFKYYNQRMKLQRRAVDYEAFRRKMKQPITGYEAFSQVLLQTFTYSIVRDSGSLSLVDDVLEWAERFSDFLPHGDVLAIQKWANVMKTGSNKDREEMLEIYGLGEG